MFTDLENDLKNRTSYFIMFKDFEMIKKTVHVSARSLVKFESN